MICTGQVNTKGQFPYILEETEENIQYLVEITRENSANKGDDFFLEFQVYNESKSRNLSISGRYKMHVKVILTVLKLECIAKLFARTVKL